MTPGGDDRFFRAPRQRGATGTPACQVNPYYLGYKILVDVKKRWDQLYAAGESRHRRDGKAL